MHLRGSVLTKSKKRISLLLFLVEPRQAGQDDKPEGSPKVPEGELLNAIYLTPRFDFALAMAARPWGTTNINDEGRTITFEHPELFDPNKEVYIYEVESEDIPPAKLRQVDEKQFAVEGVESINPIKIHNLKAGELQKYYELVNWKEGMTYNESQEEFRQTDLR